MLRSIFARALQLMVSTLQLNSPRIITGSSLCPEDLHTDLQYFQIRLFSSISATISTRLRLMVASPSRTSRSASTGKYRPTRHYFQRKIPSTNASRISTHRSLSTWIFTQSLTKKHCLRNEYLSDWSQRSARKRDANR